jgi:hypothetical protein
MFEQAIPEVVDHALPGVGLEPDADRGRHLVNQLQHHAREDEDTSSRQRAAAADAEGPGPEHLGKFVLAEHVVDHDLERPWLRERRAPPAAA